MPMKRLTISLAVTVMAGLLASCSTSSEAAGSTSTEVSAGLAFIAGLASFLSPCVLSLVPAYIGYLGGRAAGGGNAAGNRRVTFSHGVAFVLGFSTVFILFNIVASALGGLLGNLSNIIGRIGGLIVIIFGLHMTGVFRIPFLEYDVRVHTPVDRRFGYLSSFLMGIFFSAGWTPCTGPILSAIIALSWREGNIWHGALLGVIYSAGMAIPFLLAALGIGWVTNILRKHSKVMRITEIVMGVILVIIGLLLLFGKFNLIGTIFPTIDTGL
jgi:cytochrome c-type biogenesis protein